MRKKRLCLFCERWASGGIESFLYQMIRHLDLTQWEVDIVAACREDSIFTEALQSLEVGFHELSGSLTQLRANHRCFRRLLRERKYDVVHLHIYHNVSLCYARIARQEGIPVRIAHSHNSSLRDSGTRWMKQQLHDWSGRWFAKDATHLLACSVEAGRFAFPLFEKREGDIRYMPNGIDTERFRLDMAEREQIRRELALSDCFVIGHVGRFCRQKNQKFLLEVFSHIAKNRPDSRLLLVGEGEDHRELLKQATELGILQQVIFYGTSSHVETLLWAMDLLVFPSLFEGLPLSLVEAQAAGLPVLCSDRVTAEAKITEGLQYLSLQAGAEAWAEQILRMEHTQKKEDLDIRAKAADLVKAGGFDMEETVRQLEQIYCAVEDGRKAADGRA